MVYQVYTGMWNMEFLFDCSTWYLMSEHSKWARYWVEHKRRNSISSGNHVFLCFLYEHLSYKKKSTLFFFKKRECIAIHSLRWIEWLMSAADWLSQPHKILVIFHVCRYGFFQGVELPLNTPVHITKYYTGTCSLFWSYSSDT